jgi:hypothetical protein
MNKSGQIGVSTGMASILDIIRRDSVEELDKYVETHPQVDVMEDILCSAVKYDSLDIVQEYITVENMKEVRDLVVEREPGNVFEWMMAEEAYNGILVYSRKDRWMAHWRVMFRLFLAGRIHKNWEDTRDREVFMNRAKYNIIAQGTAEELRQAIEHSGQAELFENFPVSEEQILRNPHAEVVEMVYGIMQGGLDLTRPIPWTVLARYGSPESAEVARRMGPERSKTRGRPRVSDLCVAMTAGNLSMYRYMQQEFGKVAKRTKAMFLACCENGEESDIRSYWLAEPRGLAKGVPALWCRGMWKLARELLGTDKPDRKAFEKAVRARHWEIRVLQGIVYMGWREDLPVTPAFSRDLDDTAVTYGYWPWFAEKARKVGVFFSEEDILKDISQNILQD